MHELAGVYAAALTPLKDDYSPDADAVPGYLAFLESRGCHGALLLGTTGEGPSFALNERIAIFRAAIEFKQLHPQFKLLAGTGTPSLTETINLTRIAFSLGFNGVVVLPPYYFRKIDDMGLITWFDEVINKAVPRGGFLLGYHIPSVSGVSFSLDMLARMKETHPEKFAGIKDSSADADFAISLGDLFGEDLLVFTGNDSLIELALNSHAGGCITALANLYSPELRNLWEEHPYQDIRNMRQARIQALRTVLETYSPFPPILKAVLAQQHSFPLWAVRPPLMPVAEAVSTQANIEFSRAYNKTS